ncbi:MAG: hypothetical protein OXL41_00025 [Nitrospinae bacterium]|nr:hypothetical protein [Nitrospinota bacterium]
MESMLRKTLRIALAATLSLAASAAAADEGARLFAAHALAFRAAGVTGEKQAADVLAGMPGAGLVRETSPAVLWSPFFSNAIVKLGRLRSPAPMALYYDPLLDIALLTFWEKEGGSYRVSSARALPGERLNNLDAKLSLKPPWMSASGGLVDTLASTTKKRLDAFRSAHPTASQEGARDEAGRCNMRAVLPRLALMFICALPAQADYEAGKRAGPTMFMPV